jgi:hypothetical protein
MSDSNTNENWNIDMTVKNGKIIQVRINCPIGISAHQSIQRFNEVLREDKQLAMNNRLSYDGRWFTDDHQMKYHVKEYTGKSQSYTFTAKGHHDDESLRPYKDWGKRTSREPVCDQKDVITHMSSWLLDAGDDRSYFAHGLIFLTAVGEIGGLMSVLALALLSVAHLPYDSAPFIGFGLGAVLFAIIETMWSSYRVIPYSGGVIAVYPSVFKKGLLKRKIRRIVHGITSESVRRLKFKNNYEVIKSTNVNSTRTLQEAIEIAAPFLDPG